MGLFGKSKSILGLDIGSSAIKACELKASKGGGYEVINLGMVPLAPEAIVDGTILDSAVVIDAITNLIQDRRIKTKDVATSVSGNAVIIKKIQLPMMTEEELAESIQWEAEQYIPFDIEDVNIDYQILGKGAENMDVLLVAVKKDKINDYTQVISQSGLNPVLVDVDAFAMQGAFEANYESGADEVVALVNLGAAIININVLKGGTSVFWRDISSGGNKFTEEIQRQLHVSQEQAEAAKRGEAVEGVPAQNVQGILNQVTMEVATEIQKTFDFFMATSSTERIHRIVLAGGTSHITSLEGVLAERFGAKVETLNPFEQIPVGKGVDPDEAAANASQYTVALGLAMRSPADTRINLMREKRTAGPKTAAVTAPTEGLSLIHFAFIGIIALALAWVGMQYYGLKRERNRLETEKAHLEAEKKRLQPILEEKKQLEKKREALELKIKVIKELKARQQGPVRMLDELSKNLPDYVWFQSITERNQVVALNGWALNANKVADFVENLHRSGFFKVTDGPHYVYRKKGELSFRLTAQFSTTPPGEAGAETLAAAGAADAAGKKKGK